MAGAQSGARPAVVMADLAEKMEIEMDTQDSALSRPIAHGEREAQPPAERKGPAPQPGVGRAAGREHKPARYDRHDLHSRLLRRRGLLMLDTMEIDGELLRCAPGSRRLYQASETVASAPDATLQ